MVDDGPMVVPSPVKDVKIVSSVKYVFSQNPALGLKNCPFVARRVLILNLVDLCEVQHRNEQTLSLLGFESV